MATLRDMRGALGAMIGDPLEKRVGWGEQVQYLNAAQSAIEGMLWDIDRDKFLIVKAITAVDAQSDYTVSDDVREIKRIEYFGRECTQLAVRETGFLQFGASGRPVFGVNQWFSRIGQDATGLAKIRLHVLPDAAHGTLTNAIKVWYYKTTRRLHDLGVYNGVVSTTGNTTQWFDTDNPFYASGYDFWSKNSTVRFIRGDNIHFIANVSSYVPATGLFTIDSAAPNVIVAGATPDQYSCDQFSALPSQYHHLITLYAASMAAKKTKVDGSIFAKQAMREIDLIRFGYENGIDAALPGMNYGSTAPYRQGVPR